MDLRQEKQTIERENTVELSDEALVKVVGGCGERGRDDGHGHRGHDRGHDGRDHGRDHRHGHGGLLGGLF